MSKIIKYTGYLCVSANCPLPSRTDAVVTLNWCTFFRFFFELNPDESKFDSDHSVGDDIKLDILLLIR